MQKSKMLCLLSYTIYLPFTFHRLSNSSNNESLLLLFWWPLESEGPVCQYHATYAFQSEYTLCSSLNFKERLPPNRCNIWSLSEYRTDNYSQRKSVIWPVWQNGWVFVYKQSDWVWIPLLSHIVLCLHVFAKLQNERGASCRPVLIGISLLVYICWPYQSTECIQVNVPRNIASMTARGDNIPTH